MGLSIGIVGLPNVGKSTLFNALTRTQKAAAANYPFATIEPNKATVPVPDERLRKLANIAHPKRVVPTTMDFVDIAGLVRGASTGEGLGNKFLANIREADAILHVVRCFDDENITHVEGGVDPMRDVGIIETELLLADLETVGRRVERLTKLARADKTVRPALEAVIELQKHIEEGNTADSYPLHDADELAPTLTELHLLTDKKVLYLANVSEDNVAEDNAAAAALRAYARERGCETVRISGKMEEELAGMSDEERDDFLASFGASGSALDNVVRESYKTLDLISFLTAGPQEVHAWTVGRGWKAPQGAGVIHSDFERGFIRAQVIGYEDYIRLGGEAACKAAGLARMEGRDYILKDGDVVLFLFSV